jgi:sugar phosphate isomerase/epimerase
MPASRIYPNVVNKMQNRKMKLGLIPGCAGQALSDDWDGTLDALREMGYTGIELGGKYGEKMNMSLDEIRASVASHDMEVASYFSGWGPLDTAAHQTIAMARELGSPYVVWGWSPAAEKERMLDEVLPVMHKAASMIRAAGMTMIYHNHDHEFLGEVDGMTGYEWLMSQFHPDLVQCELDVGWVAYGAQDVCETIRKYRERCPVLHVRDVGDPAERGAFTEIGTGTLDIAAILRTAAEEAQCRWAIVEHSKQMALPPLEGLRVAAENLKATGYVE